MKDIIKEILIDNSDGYDQLSDNQAPSYKFYDGTLEACSEEINALFSEIKTDIEERIDIIDNTLKRHYDYLRSPNESDFLKSLLTKLK